MRQPPKPKPHGHRCGYVQGFSLHANTRVGRKGRPHLEARGKARPHLEALCRYVARPAISNARLELLDDGRVPMKLKRKWATGAGARTRDPLDLVSKLAPMIVQPRVNLLRCHRQRAARGQWRDQICPSPRKPEPCHVADAPTPAIRRRRLAWSELLRRRFGVEVLVCSCGGQRELSPLIEAGRTATKSLAHVGLPTAPRRFHAARAPPQQDLDDRWGQQAAHDPLDPRR